MLHINCSRTMRGDSARFQTIDLLDPPCSKVRSHLLCHQCVSFFTQMPRRCGPPVSPPMRLSRSITQAGIQLERQRPHSSLRAAYSTGMCSPGHSGQDAPYQHVVKSQKGQVSSSKMVWLLRECAESASSSYTQSGENEGELRVAMVTGAGAAASWSPQTHPSPCYSVSGLLASGLASDRPADCDIVLSQQY